MFDRSAWPGVQSLLDNYAGIGADDTVLVLYASDSYEAAAWVCAAVELRRIPVTRVWMRPLSDAGFGARLAAALPAPAAVAGRLVVFTFERDTMSHTRELAAALSPYGTGRCAVFRAISAGAALFADTLRVVPDQLAARNTAILERCMTARGLRITTAGGSDLEIAIDSRRHRWISNRGSARPGRVVVLPAGEVATFPAAISGTLVADFAFNVNAVTDRDARLHDHPVTVSIEDGRAVDYRCDDDAMRRFLDQCFRAHCAANVGELGFGTNFGVGDAVAMNSHINERRPGVHIGFGQHNQDPGVVGYQCAIHLDLIARGGTVWIDDEPIPLDLDHIVPSPRPHPADPRDEDVFSPEADDLAGDDCCGTLTADGLRPFSPRRP